MYRLFVIAKNNIKKQRGDMITFGLLTAITAFLIFIVATSFVGINNVYRDRFEEVNGAHILFSVPENDKAADIMEAALKKNAIDDYERSVILQMLVDYRNKKNSEYMSYSFIAESFSDQPSVMKVVDEGRKYGRDDVLIPLFMKSEFSVGDTLQIKAGDRVYDLNVAGYAQNPFFCSSVSVNIDYIYLSQDMMDIMISENAPGEEFIVGNYLYKCRTSMEGTEDMDKMGKLEESIVNDYNSIAQENSSSGAGMDLEIGLTINWALILWGNKMLPQIVMSIILVFAVIIMVIALIVVSFSVGNFIRRNLKNTGILEASGYTVSELKNALTLQIMFIGLLGTVAGVGLGLITTPMINTALNSLLGISWSAGVDIIMAGLVALGMLLVQFVTVRILSRKFNRISVLDALRGGINDHNYRRNLFPFETTHLPVSLVLSLKEAFGDIRRNIILLLITAVLTMSTLLGFGLADNFAGDPEGTIAIMGMEFGDAMVTGKSGCEEDLRHLEGVKNVLCELNFDTILEYNGESGKFSTIVNDDGAYAANKVMIEGRFPERQNEIMLTAIIADKYEIKVGDVVTVSYGNNKKEFIVCGINQRLQNAGQTLTLLFEGAERLGVSSDTINYYVTLNEGVTYDGFVDTLKDYEKESGLSFVCTNSNDFIGGTINGVTSAMSMVSVIFSVLTVLVVVFVESLLIRAKISREWRDMGVSKALGMSSGELMIQIAFSNLPVVFMGTVLGALISGEAGKNVIRMAFYYMGIKKIEFNISFVWIVVVSTGICAVAFLTSALAGRRTKRIIPVEMITEE
ncbi:MAG: hypothetical protein IKN24_01525 [Lachnospiraceae bacterium]|nr:hypothetical protein [Lachnospiraceae bacterium]